MTEDAAPRSYTEPMSIALSSGQPNAGRPRARSAGPSKPSTRERIVSAAAVLTTEAGWSGVTMGKLADRVGVSRQTVYNEIGSKPELAEAMILRELAIFLAAMEAAFSDHPDDLFAGIQEAVYRVLLVGQDNALLQAIVSASHGGSSELLPLLTTQSDLLVETAKAVLAEQVSRYGVPQKERQFAAAIDVIVRVVLSHTMQPGSDPSATAADIAWVAARTLH